MSNEGTILVVDDTHESLAMLTKILAAEGYQVRPADSGELALASVAANPPELILLDIRMPGMDGFEVLRRLKPLEATREIPVIFLSAVTDSEQRVEGLKLGAVDFITKPFQREELLARVRNHLELYQLRSQLACQAADLQQANGRLVIEIEERKRLEETLRNSEESLSITLNSIGDALIATDTSGRITRMNPAAIRLTGWQFEDARERMLDEVFRIVNALTRNPVEDPVKLVLERGEVVGLANHTVLISREGTEYQISDSAAPIRDSKGNIRGVILVFSDVTEQYQYREKLKASLHEKETMLQEIYHRVKNNMQVISSLLNMQSSYLQDETAKEALRNSVDRVKTMANIHTLLYHSGDMSRIDIGDFIRDLTSSLQQAYHFAGAPIDLQVDTTDVTLTLEQAVPCGLILNELVSNAMKHAFPEGKEGKIHITMRSQDNNIVLTVQDNGIGFSDPVDAENRKSMGMELVNILVGQLGGSIDKHVNAGTIWTTTFPVMKERQWRNG